jgi:colicin import membrane protein
MRDFSRIYLTEPNKNIEADTNEVVGLILATMILSTALRPALGDGKGGKDGGVGFWDFMINYSNNRRADRKEKEEKAEKEKAKKERAKKKAEREKAKKEKAEEDNKIFNDLLLLSRKTNAKEKDENSKKKNDAMIKLLTACSFDKDGNELPIDERIEKMKDNMSDEQFKAFKKDMLDTYEKCKDDDKFKDALNKEREKITPETYEKAMEESKKEAKTTLEQLAKEKQEIEEHEKKLDELKKQIESESNDDKKKELTAQLEKVKQNAPQTLAGAASGVTATTTSEPKSDEEKDTNSADKQDDDKTNQDGYEIKDEEITDPETGEKKKVKTYTGPRGGKFYYPDGAPKKPENKVYVEHLSLSNYLIESMQ